ncbi:MAG: hypothetical protein ABR540_14595 [Acidimicrobiales bacterium]
MTAGERYVVLGLAPPRASWFRSVGSWANSGALPAEFVKCLSAEEVGARLASGRSFSALVADASLPALDRDLVARTAGAGCAVFVVDDRRVTRDWSSLGVARVLPPDFTREDLLHALAAHARKFQRSTTTAANLVDRPVVAGWRGSVVAVTGPGGTGASTAAMALAQALGDDVRHAGMVLLADLRLNAELAMLHDAGDVCPGVQELVESHRSGSPSLEDVRSLMVTPAGRPYHLLLGLRRARFWPTLRPQAFAAAFDSLERAYRVVVADVDPDAEGEDESGSADVEDRNVMARTAFSRAQVVLAVGLPSLKGVHALVRVLEGLLTVGVPADRIVPVLNRAPRSPRVRAGFTATFAELMAPLVPDGQLARLASPVFLPERRIEEALQDGAPLPAALAQPLAGAFGAIAERARDTAVDLEPEPVRPGSLGRWTIEAAGS